MRPVAISFFLVISSLSSSAQKGYIRLDNDSVVFGFVRFYLSHDDGQRWVEVWKTKTDKKPFKTLNSHVIGYALKKDTFKVLRDFKPFQNRGLYYKTVDAKLVASGKINLYSFYETTSGGFGAPMSSVEYFILEDNETKFLKALPSADKEVLFEFFPQRYVSKYEEVKGKIKYKNIPDLVKLYNSK